MLHVEDENAMARAFGAVVEEPQIDVLVLRGSHGKQALLLVPKCDMRSRNLQPGN